VLKNDNIGCQDDLKKAIITLTPGLAFMGLHFLMLRLRLDDPLDAVAVHFGGGCVGLFFVNVFADGQGVFWKVLKIGLGPW
jgi:ammonia channel protein AmtB